MIDSSIISSTHSNLQGDPSSNEEQQNDSILEDGEIKSQDDNPKSMEEEATSTGETPKGTLNEDSEKTSNENSGFQRLSDNPVGSEQTSTSSPNPLFNSHTNITPNPQSNNEPTPEVTPNETFEEVPEANTGVDTTNNSGTTLDVNTNVSNPSQNPTSDQHLMLREKRIREGGDESTDLPNSKRTCMERVGM